MATNYCSAPVAAAYETMSMNSVVRSKSVNKRRHVMLIIGGGVVVMALVAVSGSLTFHKVFGTSGK